MSKLKTFLKNPIRAVKSYRENKSEARLQRLLSPEVYPTLSDKDAISAMFEVRFGRKPNFRHPKTYNEKLQWLKLYYRRPELIQMVDKYEVKKIVAEKIGEDYVIPTIGLWDSAEDIDFDALPEQFVLKCTHDSASVKICKDKKTFDREAAKEHFAARLKKNPFSYGREWPYLGVKPRIIAEPYLEDEASGELPDYKFFCFDGVVKALFIATERQKKGEETKFDFYDTEGKHLDLRHGHPNAVPPPPLPSQFEKMKELAKVLSKGFPHVRIDFYECNGKVYFGEYTFFHHCGFERFDPLVWDETFGSWLTLPKKKIR